MGNPKRIMLLLADIEASHLLERNILSPEGYQVVITHTCQEAKRTLVNVRPDLFILGDQLEDGDHISLAADLLANQPTLPIILFTHQNIQVQPQDAIRLGLVDWLTMPLNADEIRAAVRRGLQRSSHWEDWLKRESHRHTGPLLEKVDELETLHKIGRDVTSQLELESVLSSVVDAAVDLTGADEGSLLLLDKDSGELFMMAARNFQEDFVQTFRLPVEDTLAGEVIQTGKPVFIDSQAPQKIKTSYLVHSLIYVPLTQKGNTIGVLGVDNQKTGKAFNQRHVTLMSAMADYAVIAIDNAQLYSETERERGKMEQILTQIEDGVVVYDDQDRIILLNHTVSKAFKLPQENPAGKYLHEVFPNKDVLNALKGDMLDPDHIEITAQDKRIYNVSVTAIPSVGMVATLNDITYLKELDSLKTDFVNAVSHDLRTPLTSILGYVDLIEKSGEINDTQADFIKRVQMSVHNITDMIGELLDLGKIEVGVIEEAELVPLSPIIQEVLDSLHPQITSRKQKLDLHIPPQLPSVNGNPIHLRQVMSNLLGNAVKFTPIGGEIKLFSWQEGSQVIIQVIDTGPGIPAEEQTKIFHKFYRAKNVQNNVPGTGLGLAITKSIVDKHRGRIWVESEEGQGSTFTVVLPVAE